MAAPSRNYPVFIQLSQKQIGFLMDLFFFASSRANAATGLKDRTLYAKYAQALGEVISGVRSKGLVSSWSIARVLRFSDEYVVSIQTNKDSDAIDLRQARHIKEIRKKITSQVEVQLPDFDFLTDSYAGDVNGVITLFRSSKSMRKRSSTTES